MKLLTNKFNLNIISDNQKQAPTKEPDIALEKPIFKTIPLNFWGLTRDFKKTTYKTRTEIEELANKYPNKVVGSLPYEWIQKIPFENREQTIKTFYKDLNKIIKEYRKSKFFDTVKASNKLTKALKKAGIISNEDKIFLKYLESGVFGHVYKINFLSQNQNKNEYIIKLFKQDTDSDINGNIIEQNRALFWQKNVGRKTERVRFYFGDLDARYMINKYIPEDIPVCKKQHKPEIYGLEQWDEEEARTGHNKINGYCIDWGGFAVANPGLIKNKAARKYYEKIFSAPEETKNEEFEKLLKLKDNKDIATALIAALDLFKEPRDYYLELTKTDDQELKSLLIDKLDKVAKLSVHFRKEPFKMIYKNANNEVKLKLAQNVVKLDKESRGFWAVKLAENANNKIKLILINNLSKIDTNNIENCFEVLSKNANNEINLALAENINITHPLEAPKWFSKFIKLNNPEINQILAGKLSCLPDNDTKLLFYKKLADTNDEETKVELIKNIDVLKNDDSAKMFEQFYNKADKKLKIVLADNIWRLSTNDYDVWLNKMANEDEDDDDVKIALFFNNSNIVKRNGSLIKNADVKFIKKLLNQLKEQRDCTKLDYFRFLATAANPETKFEIAKHIDLLQEKHRHMGFSVLYENANPKTLIELAKNINLLPEDDQLYWFNIFSKIDNPNIQKALTQQKEKLQV